MRSGGSSIPVPANEKADKLFCSTGSRGGRHAKTRGARPSLIKLAARRQIRLGDAVVFRDALGVADGAHLRSAFALEVGAVVALTAVLAGATSLAEQFVDALLDPVDTGVCRRVAAFDVD
jgi:hypothetical protein